MERNKDHALMAKEMAENSFKDLNYAAAKKFALKAQSLYPNLDGLFDLLATMEVYVAAEKKVGTEVDWYAVLGAKPSDDDETIRNRYRKMAIILHPDKNKSVGAEDAFKLLLQAWTILSDKDKRTTFDENYRRWKAYEGLPVPSGIRPIPAYQNSLCNTANLGGRPPVPASTNGLFNASNWKDRDHTSAVHTNPTPKPHVASGQNGLVGSAMQKDKDHMSASHTDPTQSPSSKPLTFWTQCSFCKTNFEYLAIYKNRKLACASCKNPFLASEVPVPSGNKNVLSTSRPSQTKQHIFNSMGLDRNCHVSSRTPMSSVNSSLASGPLSMPGGISSVQSSVSTAGGAFDLFTRMSTTNLMRKHKDPALVMREEVHFGNTHAVDSSVAGSAFQLSSKRRCTGERKVYSDGRYMETEMVSKKGINLTNVFGPQN